jgi:hypothetical protein
MFSKGLFLRSNLFYWFENLIVGFFNLFKISKVSSFILGSTDAKTDLPTNIGKANSFLRIFIMLFFTAHYFGYCFVHGVFIVVFLGAVETGVRELSTYDFIRTIDWQEVLIGLVAFTITFKQILIRIFV